MTNITRIILVLFAFSTTGLFAATYVVKKGDTLANIARKRYGEPVFGPKGTINKILKQNPNLKMNVALEPGQKINLEIGAASYPAEKVPNAKPTVPAAVPAAPVAADPKLDTTPFEQAAHQMDMMPRAPVKEAKEKKEEPEDDTHVEVVPKTNPAAASSAHAAAEEHASTEGAHHPHNYFSFIPQYSLITQSATEDHETYSMHSSPAWGVELGWDHWWNSSFSTLLTYTALQFTSKESSEATGTKVLSKMLHRGELALLNKFAPWVRAGLGFAYGDHVFIEGFTDTPSDARSLKVSYLNPFAMAELTAFNSERFEVLVNLKIAQLPAQTHGDTTILAGTEYFAQVSLMQKFEKFSMLYGLAYSTENQTVSEASETRNEWALKIGALF